MKSESRQRKQFSAAFKSKVAIAALKEVETIGQLASKHGVHPTQIHQWKKQLLEGVEGVFGSPSGIRRSVSDEEGSTSDCICRSSGR